MAGLDPAIHEAAQQAQQYVFYTRQLIMDARVKPAHDNREGGE
jgi:hypothetical protein